MTLHSLRRRAQRLPPFRRRLVLAALALAILAVVFNMAVSFLSNILFLRELRQEHAQMYSWLQWYVPAIVLLGCFVLLVVILWDDPQPAAIAAPLSRGQEQDRPDTPDFLRFDTIKFVDAAAQPVQRGLFVHPTQRELPGKSYAFTVVSPVVTPTLRAMCDGALHGTPRVKALHPGDMEYDTYGIRDADGELQHGRVRVTRQWENSFTFVLPKDCRGKGSRLWINLPHEQTRIKEIAADEVAVDAALGAPLTLTPYEIHSRVPPKRHAEFLGREWTGELTLVSWEDQGATILVSGSAAGRRAVGNVVSAELTNSAELLGLLKKHVRITVTGTIREIPSGGLLLSPARWSR